MLSNANHLVTLAMLLRGAEILHCVKDDTVARTVK
jgi:hypothetical protein